MLELGTAVDHQYTIDDDGATTPKVRVADGVLPTGLTLDDDGHLHGTPTVGGQFDFTVEAYDDGDATTITDTIDESVAVEAEAAFDDAEVPDGTINQPYDHTFVTTGYPVPVVTTDSDLPDGLQLDEDGRLHGTPTEAGTFPIALTAQQEVGQGQIDDAAVGDPVSRSVTLVIADVEDEPTTPEPVDEPTDQGEGEATDDAPAASSTPAADELADTGADAAGALPWASGAVIFGAWLMAASRRMFLGTD